MTDDADRAELLGRAWTFTPEKLKQSLPYADDPEFDFLVNRARECLLFRMSPEYWDNMTQKETIAWITAHNKLQKESQPDN